MSMDGRKGKLPLGLSSNQIAKIQLFLSIIIPLHSFFEYTQKTMNIDDIFDLVSA